MKPPEKIFIDYWMDEGKLHGVITFEDKPCDGEGIPFVEYHLAPQWRDAEKDPPDKDGDYHCLWDGEVFIGAYTIVHGFENNCEKWQEIYRPLPIESEGE